MSNDESTLRARNIERPIPPELNNARGLMRELEQAAQRKRSAPLVFGQTPPPPPAHHKCVVCKSTRWGLVNGKWECLECWEKKQKARTK